MTSTQRKLEQEIRANGSLNDILIWQRSEIIVKSFSTPRLGTVDQQCQLVCPHTLLQNSWCSVVQFPGSEFFFSRYFSSLWN